MSGCRIVAKGRGPLAVEGPFELVDEDGVAIPRPPTKRVLLCRCGTSTSRPFCDGSHNRIPSTPSDGDEPDASRV